MRDALIGYTGFVGSVLLNQTRFNHLYNSMNIQDIVGKEFDTIICAGAPGQKWFANTNPEQDFRSISYLIENLKKVKCKQFVLISTVDVFKNPLGVDENSEVLEEGLSPYGLNRRKLEKFVEMNFDNYLIVRLPGLVGMGLRKNVIYDIQNSNNLSKVESRAIFQFYPMVNLWFDINLCLRKNLKLVHFTAEPISVAELAMKAFDLEFKNELDGIVPLYDFQTIHASVFGGLLKYQYSKRETIQAIRSYVQFENFVSKKN
jgi:hypothetical protein